LAIGTGGTVTVITRTTSPIIGHMATTTGPITAMATATPTIGPITMVGVPALAFGLASRLTEKSTYVALPEDAAVCLRLSNSVGSALPFDP